MKETLRVHPPAPLLVPRDTLGKCSIDGYDIPPKTLVYVNAWAIGRDPEVWENPEEFLPERFLGSSVDFKGQDYQLIPFGVGRRICSGIHLGVVPVELADRAWSRPMYRPKRDKKLKSNDEFYYY